MKIELNGFERQPLFEIKMFIVKKTVEEESRQFCNGEVQKRRKKSKQCKHWIPNSRISKVV